MGVIDILILAVIGIVAWCIASEGAVSAGLTCLCVLFGGLLAMNFFEPFANFLQRTFSSNEFWGPRWDMIALLSLFAIFVTVLRIVGETLLPAFVDVQPIAHEVGRWGSGVLAGYITAAILLTALHTTPLPREFLGFRPERNNLLEIAAPDRQWLGFVQFVSEKTMPTGRIFDGPTFELTRGSGVKVWPSFPIRYATRRDQLARGEVIVEATPPTGAGAAPTTVAPGPTNAGQPTAAPGGKPDF